MNEADWYEIAHGRSLLQGDILLRCPVFIVTGEMRWPMPVESDVRIAAHVFDLVVMTQSCDLENDKVEDVLLAELTAWPDAVKAEVQRGTTCINRSP